MKKFFLFISLALLISSCRGPMGPMGPAGHNGKDGKDAEFQVIELTIRSDQWEFSQWEDNNLYFAQFEMPEISADVYKYGNVQVYQKVKPNQGSEFKTPLPNVSHIEYEDPVGSGTYYSYTRTTDYSYWPGWIEIHITYSDFIYNPEDLGEPGDRDFTVVITY